MTNLDLIKQTYMKCQGNTMHMAREYCDVYEMYKQLDPGEDILKEWDLELLESLFAMLWEDPGFVWGRHGQIIEVLNRGRVDIGYWVARLLDEMEKMDVLDKKNKILIIENMSGINTREDLGGVHLICTSTEQGSRMADIMNKLMDFSCTADDDIDQRGWDNMLNRFLVATASYEKAMKRFGNTDGKTSVY